MTTERRRETLRRYRLKHKDQIRAYRSAHKNERAAYDRARYLKNREQILKKRKQDYLLDREQELARQKEYRRKNKDRISAYFKAYRERKREILNEYWRKHRAANKDKIRVQNMGRYLPKGSFCENCGSTENLHRHHPDYSRPNEIITLCQSCHRKLHVTPFAV